MPRSRPTSSGSSSRSRPSGTRSAPERAPDAASARGDDVEDAPRIGPRAELGEAAVARPPGQRLDRANPHDPRLTVAVDKRSRDELDLRMVRLGGEDEGAALGE